MCYLCDLPFYLTNMIHKYAGQWYCHECYTDLEATQSLMIWEY